MDSVFHGLKRDEYAFEIILRGGTPQPSNRLSETWLLAHEGDEYVENLPLNLGGEIEVCTIKRTILSGLVDSHQSGTNSLQHIALSNRLAHMTRP